MKVTYPVLEIADVADVSSLYHPLVVFLVPDRRSTFGVVTFLFWGVAGRFPFF
jgi:hypothetical protein